MQMPTLCRADAHAYFELYKRFASCASGQQKKQQKFRQLHHNEKMIEQKDLLEISCSVQFEKNNNIVNQNKDSA
jgi:hypothetical protein